MILPIRMLSNLTRLIRYQLTVFPQYRRGKLFCTVCANISFASLLRHSLLKTKKIHRRSRPAPTSDCRFRVAQSPKTDAQSYYPNPHRSPAQTHYASPALPQNHRWAWEYSPTGSGPMTTHRYWRSISRSDLYPITSPKHNNSWDCLNKLLRET